jgi:hypothetical protein
MIDSLVVPYSPRKITFADFDSFSVQFSISIVTARRNVLVLFILENIVIELN